MYEPYAHLCDQYRDADNEYTAAMAVLFSNPNPTPEDFERERKAWDERQRISAEMDAYRIAHWNSY